jgi:hypothetical protein
LGHSTSAKSKILAATRGNELLAANKDSAFARTFSVFSRAR